MGPLLLALSLLVLPGCFSGSDTVTVETALDEDTILSGGNTSLHVTVSNQGETPVTGTIIVQGQNTDRLKATHSEPSLLSTTLHPGESVTRVLTVTATTATRRTDYDINTSFHEQNNTVSTTDILSVTQQER